MTAASFTLALGRRLALPVVLGLSLLVPVQAQQTAPVAQSAPSTSSSTAPARRAGATTAQPLSPADILQLRELYAKVRPATLRIMQCPINDCSDPDGIGSGVLISADGLALTAYHVIEGAKNLTAQTLDRTYHSVQVVGYDDQHDIALLRVNVARGTPFLPVAAASPKVGDAALAVGNGNGSFLRDKVGRLTGLDAAANRADFPPGTLELNAPLIPGDSGGPILNTKGEVMGIVSYISVSRQGNSAYAVPVTLADARLADLRNGVKRDAPVIGITLSDPYGFLMTLDEEDFAKLSAEFKLGSTPGAFFTQVVPGGPAAKAGLLPLKLNNAGQRISGDIVTAVNGKRIINFSEFQYAVRSYAPGDTVTLTVLRDGKTLEIKLTLAPRTILTN